MSRSIHTTYRALLDARSDDYRERSAKRERVREIRDELRHKRRVKRSTAKWRAAPAASFGAAPMPTIHVDAPRNHVVFPASAADVEGLIKWLPAGILEGVREIRLELGHQTQVEFLRDAEDDATEPDPHTGRPSYELLPGVYCGPLLGRYAIDDARIHLYAYVRSDDLPHRDVLDSYLRLITLSTFVHEVAHHVDHQWRVARGRWRADVTHVVERYAEHVQHDWVGRYVAPYLRDAHTKEYDRLDAWMRLHAGTALPLAALAGDPRTTTKDGGLRWIYGVTHSLRAILNGLEREAPSNHIRLEVARDLRCAEAYEPALGAAESVLRDAPEHLEARVVQAEILARMNRISEALSIAEAALDEAPRHVGALEVRGWIAEASRSWEEVVSFSERLRDIDRVAFFPGAAKRLARAYLETERWTELDELVALSRTPRGRAELESFVAIGLLRRERWDEALAVADACLAAGSAGHAHTRLIVVKADVKARRGCPPALDRDVTSDLRDQGFDAWADRLDALCPPERSRRRRRVLRT